MRGCPPFDGGALATVPVVVIRSGVDDEVDRRRTVGEQQRRVVRVGRLTIDRDASTALAGQPHKAFGRDELTREIWG